MGYLRVSISLLILWFAHCRYAHAQDTQALALPIVAQTSGAQDKAMNFAVSAAQAKVNIASTEIVEPTKINGKVPIFVFFNRLNIPPSHVRPIEVNLLRWMANALQARQLITVGLLDMGGYKVILQLGVPARIGLLGIEEYNKTTRMLDSTWKSGEPPATAQEQASVTAVVNNLRLLDLGGVAPEYKASAYSYVAELKAIAAMLAKAPGRKSVLLMEELLPMGLDDSEGRLTLGLNVGANRNKMGDLRNFSFNATYLTPDAQLTIDFQQMVEALNAAHVSIYRVGRYFHNSEPNSDLLAKATGGIALDGLDQVQQNVEQMINDFGPYTILHCTAETKPKLDWHTLTVRENGSRLNRAPVGFFSLKAPE